MYSSPVRHSPPIRASSYCAAVRLACVRPAASVHSEPGSNSSLKCFDITEVTSNASSADVFSRTRTTHQHLHAFESFLLFLERLLMDSRHQPDVRISILRTLSKICG